LIGCHWGAVENDDLCVRSYLQALGDALEAVVGAVLVDCGFDLPTVWRTIQPFLQLDRTIVMQPQVRSP
jgi:dsRNA-specific ribonuclease